MPSSGAGALIEWQGYEVMWLAMAVMGAAVTASLSQHYDRARPE